MPSVLTLSHIVISIILMILILMQNKEGGLGSIMGSGRESFQPTRRGAEKVIYFSTIVFAILFLANGLLAVFFQ